VANAVTEASLELALQGADAFDFFDGATAVLSTSKYVVYDNHHLVDDVALQFCAVANLTTSRVKVAVYTYYGHHESTNRTPARRALSVILSWYQGGPLAGSASTMALDIPPSINWRVISGQAIPPLIFEWDLTTRTLVGTPYFGHQFAFIENDVWWAYPPGSATGNRFAFRFFPHLENMADSRIFRNTEGGRWLRADGTWVRADLMGFTTYGFGNWYVSGRFALTPTAGYESGFWMDRQFPDGTNSGALNFRHLPDVQHATSGYIVLEQAFYNGGEAYWTHPAYHIELKRDAAQYLCHYPDPDDGGIEFFNRQYQDQTERAMGRLLSRGIWCWRALKTLATYRTGDAECATLRDAVFARWQKIFRLIWQYRKPYALPGEPVPIYGEWWRIQDSREPHPNDGYDGVPVGAILKGTSAGWEGTIFWHGLYHSWEVLREEGLASSVDVTRLEAMMRFVAIGDGCSLGVYDITYRWTLQDPPWDPPQSAYPWKPNWSSKPDWPAPKFYSFPGYGWRAEYVRFEQNIVNSIDIDEDVRYTSSPSAHASVEGVAMYEWIAQQGLKNETKLNEILIDYTAAQPYRYRLAKPVAADRKAFSDSMRITETLHHRLISGVTPIRKHFNDTVEIGDSLEHLKSGDVVVIIIGGGETLPVDLTGFRIIAHGSDTIEVADELDSFQPLRYAFTETAVRITDSLAIGETTIEFPIYRAFTDTIRISAPPGMPEGVARLGVPHINAWPDLIGTGVSLIELLAGEDEEGNMYANQRFVIVRGDNLSIRFRTTLDQGRTLNGTEGWTFAAKRRKTDVAPGLLLTKTFGSVEIADQTTFDPVVHIAPDDMPKSIFLPSSRDRDWFFDLQMTKDGLVETVASGIMVVVTDVAD